VRRTSGSAQLLGVNAGVQRGRRRVGFLPEHHRIPRHLTAYTALDYYGGLSNLSSAEVRRRRDSLLDMVGLSGWGRTAVRKFSKGMQQRLGLAQAMLHDPELLILDEPTDGVDPEGRAQMRQVLERLKAERKTIFLNSHLLQEVELVCDRVAILDRGLLRREGTIEELTRTDGRLAVCVAGLEPAVRQALAGRALHAWLPRQDRQFEFQLDVRDQAEIDHCIDALRAAQVSIVSLAPVRDTLEDAFLAVVREGKQTA
jgi:ABC-2 type transport system ATP-binding protein